MKQISNERLLLRIDEVAQLIGVSRTTAYALVNKRELPSVRIGGLLRIPADALRTLIEERAVHAIGDSRR
jgi:excisionase family DNA binding protein